MAREKRPYKRKKGSPKQKRELDSFNIFTDELVAAYHVDLKKKKNILKK